VFVKILTGFDKKRGDGLSATQKDDAINDLLQSGTEESRKERKV